MAAEPARANLMAASESIAEARDAWPGPPPLRIHHILVATAVTAVLLSASGALRQYDEFGVGQYLTTGPGIFTTISTGLAATLVGYGFAWRSSGRRFFHQPGHWLLLELAMMVGMFVLAALDAVVRMAGGGNASVWLPATLFFLLLQLMFVAICLLAAWKAADTFAWRLLFLFEAAFILFTVLWPVLIGINYYFSGYYIVSVAIFFVMIWAALSDWRSRRQRDWPPWVGVVLRLGNHLVMLGEWLVGLALLTMGSGI